MLIKRMAFLIMMMALTFSSTAHAGWKDKLNAAADKLKQAATPAKTEAGDKPLHLEDHYTGSCEGKRSATCMDYMELMDQCMEPLRGYRMKLTAERIEKKLKMEKLTAAQKKNLEEDLVGIKEAAANKSDDPTIAGKAKSQRYLSDISEEDQVYINAEYGCFHNKITNKCVGADHMQTGHRTEIVTEKCMTGDEAVAQYRKEHARDTSSMDCMKKISGVRFKVIADLMEQKMSGMKFTDKERSQWMEDIAALRKAADEGGMAMPQVNDPVNPYRPTTRLSSPAEQAEINAIYTKKSQEFMAECQGQSGRIVAAPSQRELYAKSGTTTSQMKAKAAEPKVEKKKKKAAGGDSLSASLGATNLDYFDRDGVGNCHDPIKGKMAKFTADKLEAKFKTARNLSAQEKKEWQDDITSWREAEKYNANLPDAPDPDNPYRWQDRLTKEERQQINGEYSTFVNQINKKCNEVDHMGVGN